ncbi:MAG: DegV family protein [Anaerolineae bacterium]
MSKVAVITDTCASLPDDFYEKYDIARVPYYVHIGTKAFRDLIDITREEFLDYMRKATELPKSANPGPGDYIEKIKAAAHRAKEIVIVCMTSIGSGAYQAALVAKETALKELSNIRVEVVDTRNVSMAHGWMALEAARAALAGATLDDILALIQRMIPVTRMLQTADTLRYLYLGGRIGRAKHLVGSLLNIKPLISMEDGEIVALGQERSRPAVYRRMVGLIAEKVGPGGKIKAAIVHAADEEAARVLRELVEKSFECVEMLTTNLSSALAVHTGPGTVGVCYFPLSVLEK